MNGLQGTIGGTRAGWETFSSILSHSSDINITLLGRLQEYCRHLHEEQEHSSRKLSRAIQQRWIGGMRDDVHTDADETLA